MDTDYKYEISTKYLAAFKEISEIIADTDKAPKNVEYKKTTLPKREPQIEKPLTAKQYGIKLLNKKNK